jgi:heme exporter protein D
MSWNTPAEFFAMGGYALYVWGAYAVSALALGLEVWLLRRRMREALRRGGTAGGAA